MSDDQQSDDVPEAPDQHRPEGRPGDREGPEETDKSRDRQDKQDGERDDKENERALAAEQFKAYTRAPFAEEQGEDGPTDLAAASRAAARPGRSSTPAAT